MISNYVGVLRKYAVFRGRATRTEYWLFALAQIIVFVALGVLTAVGGSVAPVLGLPLVVYWIGTIIPSLAVTARRFHDADEGYSGWMVLLVVIPAIGGIVLLIFMVLPSERRDNRHGAYPHGARG